MANTNHTRTTRRAILTGIAATTAATAALAVPAASATTTDVDAVLAAWRVWWGHTIQWHRLRAESKRLWETLPEEVRLPRVEIFEDARDRKAKIATSHKEIERLTHPQAYWPMSEREKARRAAVREEKFAELAERKRDAEAQIVASGHRAVVEQMSEASRRASEPEGALDATTDMTPIAIAARCHLALDGLAQYDPKAFIDSSPWSRGLAFLIRDLLPQLPADMAVAMAPATEGWRQLKDIWDAVLEDGSAAS